MPPPPPFVPQGGYPDGGWLKPTADHMELATPGTVDQFSAACWFFGQSLTDGWVERGEPVVPLGMVTSNWGGTTVQQWTPVTALPQCMNATGGSTSVHLQLLVKSTVGLLLTDCLWLQRV